MQEVSVITEFKSRPRLAWVRYGNPLSPWQIKKAAGRYRAAILQPWELEAAEYLKATDPTVTVLAYKCLSSIRDYEPGPIYSSGISPVTARKLGTTADVAEWKGYNGHIQQRVWEPEYQQAWIKEVSEEIIPGPFDGVMADNDVYEDYYDHGLDMESTRAALGQLVSSAGKTLNDAGKILVPNIAESRLEPGRWNKHSNYGGGFEECWLGWGSAGEGWLSPETCLEQVAEMSNDRLIIARVPGYTRNYHHHLSFALAAAWVFLPTQDVAVTATGHDQYNGVPLIDDIDLGEPTSDFIREGDSFRREFSGGEAMVNLGSDVDVFGLAPHSGRILAR